MNTNRHEVMLVTSVDIDSNGVGALFLKDLIKENKDISVTPVVIGNCLDPAKYFKNKTAIKAIRTIFLRFKIFQFFRFFFFQNKSLYFYLDLISRKAISLKSKKIWITASSPELIIFAKKMIELGMDVRLMIWDAPEYFLSNQKIFSKKRKKILEDFYFSLRHSCDVSVISDSMNDMYVNYLARKGLVIRHGINANFVEKNNAVLQSEINIVFAGSLYAKAEWNSLLHALDNMRWMVDNRKINVYFIGGFPIKGAYKSSKVNYLGNMSFDEVMHFMKTMHIGYLPYPFGEEDEILAKTSFPGKMSAYAAAGLYVFHHAPSYTEATRFLSQNPFGISCDTLDEKLMISYLRLAIAELEKNEFNSIRLKAVETELSQEIMVSRLNKFLFS